MKVYKIEYKETQTAYFGVEADNEEEALERFEEWMQKSDRVYRAMEAYANIESDVRIEEHAVVYDEDVLTDEMYKKL